MISTLLRVEMLAVALAFALIIIYYVNQKHIRLEYMLLWLLIAAGLLIAAIFPGAVGWLCRVTGIETPANLLSLLGILILLLISFHHSIVLSRKADAIKHLTQIVSLEKHEREQEETRDGR